MASSHLSPPSFGGGRWAKPGRFANRPNGAWLLDRVDHLIKLRSARRWVLVAVRLIGPPHLAAPDQGATRVLLAEANCLTGGASRGTVGAYGAGINPPTFSPAISLEEPRWSSPNTVRRRRASLTRDCRVADNERRYGIRSTGLQYTLLSARSPPSGPLHPTSFGVPRADCDNHHEIGKTTDAGMTAGRHDRHSSPERRLNRRPGPMASGC